MLRDLYTFLEKAVPDTKLTLKKYSDAKFEFLVCSYPSPFPYPKVRGWVKFNIIAKMFRIMIILWLFTIGILSQSQRNG